jgi:hypothetical protein
MFREEKLYFNRYKAGNEALKLHKFIFSSTLNLIFSLIYRAQFCKEILPSKCQEFLCVILVYILTFQTGITWISCDAVTIFCKLLPIVCREF